MEIDSIPALISQEVSEALRVPKKVLVPIMAEVSAGKQLPLVSFPQDTALCSPEHKSREPVNAGMGSITTPHGSAKAIVPSVSRWSDEMIGS